MKIGIVGLGFVGTAVKKGFESLYDIEVYDTDPKKTTVQSLKELAETSSVIFVSVPTPMRNNGECDTRILAGVLEQLDNAGKKMPVVIKSTVPPGTTDRFQIACNNLKLVFNPEFLTERNFIQDFMDQTHIILGAPDTIHYHDIDLVEAIYQLRFPDASIVVTGAKEAEMFKYVANTFLAVKVAFANEMFQICTRAGISYRIIQELIDGDERLGKTHWAVPGHDGHFGFGGTCFPKDVNALIEVAKKLGVAPMVLEGAWEKNLEVRPEKDWENLKGRAVSNN
jgi:nucleotide sugar dehydrogenase